MRHETAENRYVGDGVDLAADVREPGGPARGSVLLLHGGGQTRHSWLRTGERLAENGWRSVSLDLRGHGDSDWAPDGDYRIDTHARDVAAVAAAQPDRPVLVGASLGGMSALHAQAADPDLARALVLVDITPQAEPEGLQRIHQFMSDGLAGFDSLESALDAVVAYNPNRRRVPRVEGLRKNLRHRDGRWYWHWDPRILDQNDNAPEGAALREAAAREAAASITVPTLLIRGGQSDIVSERGVADLLSTIPNARHLDVAGAGHMVGGDDNDVLSEGLLDFLDGLD